MTKLTPDIFTLHRYFIWADRMRVHLDELLQKGPAENKNYELETFLYMSYWYAGTYVVIEGWKECGISDATVDALLESVNVDLLRLYRNGVFHYRKRYFDERRFAPLIEQGDDVVKWIRQLRDAFGVYFLRVLKDAQDGS